MLGGTDLQKITGLNCTVPGCLQVYQNLASFTLSSDNFQRLSKTSAVLTLDSQTAKPYFTESAKPCHACTATIADTNKGATIFYTTDGIPPTPASTPYNHQFAVHAPATIRAIAFAPNLIPSDISTLNIDSAGAIDGPGKPPNLPKPPKFDFKSYRVVWHPSYGDQAIEWDLSAPPQDKSSVTASAVLNEQDVTDIDFNNVDVYNDKTTMNFSFNGVPLPNPSFKYDGAKKTLTFYVTGDMTSKPGHKVIIMNAYKQKEDGTRQPTQVLLPFDVTKR
jgi:hypothetical protein